MISYQGSFDMEDITECADSILTTPYGTMPYMRDLGITSDVIGVPTETAKMEYFNQAVDQIETWEDRVTVDEITSTESNGTIEPKVVLRDSDSK